MAGLRFSASIVACSCFLFVAGLTRADVRLPALVGDNMVLQQHIEVRVWGWAAPGEHVSVSPAWAQTPAETTANANGTWEVTLATPGASGPFEITVSGSNRITLHNVLIGEVWVCSGQSNMEWSFAHGVTNGEQECASAEHPRIRLFDVPHATSLQPQDGCQGEWTICDPKSVRGFSAVGYFFGREIHQKLNVPVGLIGSNWGGTVAEAWASAEGLGRLGDYAEILSHISRAREDPSYWDKAGEQQLTAWWAALERLDGGRGAESWMRAPFDDSSWKETVLPSLWETQGYHDFDGVFWFRKEVQLPDTWAGQDLALELGPIDDMDTTWFNGIRVGGMERGGAWATPRRYIVPASAVQAGRNVIAVRVVDTGGGGGICGQAEQLQLRPADGSGDEAISLAGPWRYHPTLRLNELPPWPAWTSMNQNTPTVLFNGMIAPLTPFTIRGVIWYQGESNRSQALRYETLFSELIRDWRRHWAIGEFPFYFVQIAPFAYDGDIGETGALRDAQRRVLSLPNTGMAVTLDIGDPKNIHPRNKQEVGRRLALWALANTYGQSNLVYSGPLYERMRVEDGRIRLFFDHTAGGLKPDGPLSCFLIAGEDRRFVPAQAQVENDSVLVWSDSVPEPVAVRYAWNATDEPNLTNGAGLPAACFRTDDWPQVSPR